MKPGPAVQWLYPAVKQSLQIAFGNHGTKSVIAEMFPGICVIFLQGFLDRCPVEFSR